MFYTKAVAVWNALGDSGRLRLIGDYFRYSASGFGAPRALDITARRVAVSSGGGGKSHQRDPMFIVEATKEE